MMKRMYLLTKLFLVVAVCLVATSCKKSQNEPTLQYYQGNTLNQYYTVNFIKADTLAIINAWFTDARNGHQLIFADRSLVTANGVVDSALYSSSREFFDWHIHSSTISFSVNKQNKTLTNVVSSSSVNDITIVMDSVLSVKDTMHASFSGAALADDEYIGLSMNRDSDSTNQWSGISYQFLNRQCTLDFSQTKNFYPGNYTVLLVRMKNIPLQQLDENSRGNISVTITDRKKVVVK